LVKAMLADSAWVPVTFRLSVPALVTVAVPVKKFSGVPFVEERLRVAPAAFVSVLTPPVVKPKKRKFVARDREGALVEQLLPPVRMSDVLLPVMFTVVAPWVVSEPGQPACCCPPR